MVARCRRRNVCAIGLLTTEVGTTIVEMIRARGLEQTFRTRKGKEKVDVKAVDGVDLDVAEGEILGFLGPNGAGKTTTLRMLTTLLRPTAGEARVAGFDVLTQSREVRKNIGYVSQVGSTGNEVRAGEEIVDHGMLYGLGRKEVTARAEELFAQLDLEGMWERKPSKMSGGQRRRLDIAMGLVHRPRLVFLDEPTTGLDPQARANLWEHIRGLRENHGATIVITTHYLDEADALSDRLVVIDHGKIVASDTQKNLKAQVAGDLVVLTVADPGSASRAAQVLDNAGAEGEVAVDGSQVSARIPQAGRALPEIVGSLEAAGIGLESLDVTHPTLDDVFLELTGRSLRES